MKWTINNNNIWRADEVSTQIQRANFIKTNVLVVVKVYDTNTSTELIDSEKHFKIVVNDIIILKVEKFGKITNKIRMMWFNETRKFMNMWLFHNTKFLKWNWEKIKIWKRHIFQRNSQMQQTWNNIKGDKKTCRISLWVSEIQVNSANYFETCNFHIYI